MLDTKGVEGSDDWSGHLVGTVVTFSHRGELHTLEGDPRFFLDDSKTPQVQGTGTEEWGGGGDYWQGGEISSLPLVGHPTGVGGGQVRGDTPNRRRRLVASYLTTSRCWGPAADRHGVSLPAG